MKGRRNNHPCPLDDADEELREYASSPCYLSELDSDYLWAQDTPETPEWPAIREWRRERRQRLASLRRQYSDDDRARADQAILRHLDREQLLDAGKTAVYWPLPGEFDSRPILERVLDLGGTAAIPVILARDAPLEFWFWDRQTTMQARGPWDIPAPTARHVVDPATIVIPLLGFDAAGHRLGNGGGYFDRTLAMWSPRPFTIGVGYECGRLETIYPQAHDVPLDVIVTEAGVRRHRPRTNQ
jgi:5-formyltetrahydrofolate cyclo-ligase